MILVICSLIKKEVIDKWKNDYENLYNENIGQSFDGNHLHQIQQLLENSIDDGSVFPKADCSSLNTQVTREEVRQAVYKMKNGKASGADEIPVEVLKNEKYIKILHKIMYYCFSTSKIPTDWSRGIINPIHKNDGDPRNPLGYRPITLISDPCKVYAQIINTRLENG